MYDFLWPHRLTVSSVQFSSVAQSCPTLRPHESQHARRPCPSSTPGVHSDLHPSSQWYMPQFSVLQCLLELAQIHIPWVNDAILLSHPLLLLSLDLNLSQHQGLFHWVRSSYQVAKGLELQHQSFQWILRTCNEYSAQENKICHSFHHFPIYLPWSDGSRCHDVSFWMLSFKPAFSLSCFAFIKRLFSTSSLSAIRMVSSAYLRLFLQQSWFQLVFI